MLPLDRDPSWRTMPVDRIAGHWCVRRIAGLLPPFGLSKRISGRRAWTCVAGFPLLLARVERRGPDTLLRYWLLPIHDRLEPAADGTWLGRGFCFGREFCRFRLVPET